MTQEFATVPLVLDNIGASAPFSGVPNTALLAGLLALAAVWVLGPSRTVTGVRTVTQAGTGVYTQFVERTTTPMKVYLTAFALGFMAEWGADITGAFTEVIPSGGIIPA